MADVEVKYDKAKLKRVQRLFADFPKAVPRIMSRAVNRTSITAKAQIARRIAGKIKLKVSDVKKYIHQKKATYRNWISILNFRSKKIPLIKFKISTFERGIKYKGDFDVSDVKGRKRTTVSAFIATMKSGHTGVFKRRSERRLPIDELYGPSVAEVFDGDREIAKTEKAVIEKNLAKNIDGQVKLQLEKRKSAG